MTIGKDSLMTVFMVMVMMMMKTFPLDPSCASRTIYISPICDLGVFWVVILDFLTGPLAYLRPISSSRKFDELTTTIERGPALRLCTWLRTRRGKGG